MKLGQPIDLTGDRPILVKSGNRTILDAIAAMKDAQPQSVNVAAPVVHNPITVTPALIQPSQWLFEHTYDQRGNLIRTIATATPV
jgi:hypothetical protein